MKNSTVKPLVIALACALYVPHSLAEVVNETWMVRSGDGLYNIARKLAPKDLQMQARIRNEIVQLNPGVNTNSLEIGISLKLPTFLFKQAEQPQPPVKSIEPPAPQQISRPAVTPDPTEVIGRVVIQSGDMVAVNRGSSRKLNRTANILKGDTLKTASNARSQIRLKDGALIALSPDTELKIEDFAYNGSEDGSERSIISLIKGGFRTITGAIGHTNKQNYQVKTSVATIGIRGTHYGLMLCEAGSCQNNPEAGNLNDGLYGGVVDGSIVTENASGVSTFNNDQFFHIQTAQTPPVETLLPPPVFQDTPPQGSDQPQQDMANGPGPQGPGPDGQRPEGPMQGMGPNGQPGPGPRDGMMAGDFRFNHNPMMPGFFNNDFLPPKDFQLLPGTQPGDATNTALPPPAPSGSGIAIAFSSVQATDPNMRATAAPIYIWYGLPNGVFLESITDSSGNVIKNLPFAIHEEHDIFDPQTGTVIGHQVHDAVRNRPDGTGAVHILSSLGGNGTYGVNWGRWQGNFVVVENGTPLPHDNNFHFIYSDRLTPKDTLFNLGGLKSKIELYGIIGGTLPTDNLGNVATNLPRITASFDFVNHQMLHYSVAVNDFSLAASTAGPLDFSFMGDGFNLVTGNADCPSCIGNASIMFVGGMADAAMTSYSIYDQATYSVSGTGLLAPLSNTAANGSSGLFAASNAAGNLISFASVVNTASGDNMYLNTNNNPVAAFDRWVDTSSITHYNSMLVNPSTAILLAGGVDTTTVTGTTVYWGRWDAANVSSDTIQLQNVAADFIGSSNITTPTQLAALTGTMLYGAYAANVHAYDGAGNPITGIGDGAITMTANFNTAQITAYDINLPNLQASLALPVDFTDLGNRFNLVGTTTPVPCTGTCAAGYANVQFIGPNADGAITSFAIQNTVTPTIRATGTAVMVDNW